MQLDKYKGVIKLVLARHAGETPEAITEHLFRSLEIAQVMAGELPDISTQSSIQKVSSETPASVSSRPNQSQNTTSKVVIISAAPPVAGSVDSSAEEDDDQDYWESKPGKGDGCRRLEKIISELLPTSITLQLPNIDKPLTLVRGVGSPGVRFVNVNYSIPGGDLGPRIIFMTSQKPPLDKDAILEDIAQQAATFYSAEKRVVVSNPGPPVQPPSGQEMQAALERDIRSRDPRDKFDGLSGDDANQSAKIATEWSSSRGVNWR